MKHLWFYFDKRFQYLKKLKFVFGSGEAQRFIQPSNNFFIMVENIGIPKEKFFMLEKPTRFSRVYVPDDCFVSDFNLNKCYYTKEYLNLLSFLPKFPPPKNLNVEKIYFSRTAFQSNKDFNEKDIENFFKHQGFTIIYPEKIDFLSALAILQNCNIFAATDGSIAHNLLFCKNKTTTIICRKIRRFTQHQIIINSLKKANVVYIDVCFSPFLYDRNDWHNGPFFLYESNYLRHYFNLPSKKIPLPFLKFSYYIFLSSLRFFTLVWDKFDRRFFAWTRPMRNKLQIGRRIKRLFE